VAIPAAYGTLRDVYETLRGVYGTLRENCWTIRGSYQSAHGSCGTVRASYSTMRAKQGGVRRDYDSDRQRAASAASACAAGSDPVEPQAIPVDVAAAVAAPLAVAVYTLPDKTLSEFRAVQIVEAWGDRVGATSGNSALAGGTTAAHSDSGEVSNRKLPCGLFH